MNVPNLTRRTRRTVYRTRSELASQLMSQRANKRTSGNVSARAGQANEKEVIQMAHEKKTKYGR